MDGGNRHTVLEGVPHAFAITIFEEWMYWTDWNHKTVEKANRFTGADRQVLRNTTHRPMDIHVMHKLRQKQGQNKNNVMICRIMVIAGPTYLWCVSGCHVATFG